MENNANTLLIFRQFLRKITGGRRPVQPVSAAGTPYLVTVTSRNLQLLFPHRTEVSVFQNLIINDALMRSKYTNSNKTE